MRKMLRAFLAWCDKRFPERVVVTEAEFLTMKAQLDVVSKLLNEKRLEKIEAEINKFNVAMGFGGSTVIPKGMVAPFQR